MKDYEIRERIENMLNIAEELKVLYEGEKIDNHGKMVRLEGWEKGEFVYSQGGDDENYLTIESVEKMIEFQDAMIGKLGVRSDDEERFTLATDGDTNVLIRMDEDGNLIAYVERLYKTSYPCRLFNLSSLRWIQEEEFRVEFNRSYCNDSPKGTKESIRLYIEDRTERKRLYNWMKTAKVDDEIYPIYPNNGEIVLIRRIV